MSNRKVTYSHVVAPEPERELQRAVQVLDATTEGDAKLRLRRFGPLVFLVITGRPWIIIPRLTVSRKSVTVGWLLWMVHAQKKSLDSRSRLV